MILVGYGEAGGFCGESEGKAAVGDVSGVAHALWGVKGFVFIFFVGGFDG